MGVPPDAPKIETIVPLTVCEIIKIGRKTYYYNDEKISIRIQMIAPSLSAKALPAPDLPMEPGQGRRDRRWRNLQSLEKSGNRKMSDSPQRS
jgi:hypothetical protein